MAQSAKSQVVICTLTPFEEIEGTCQRFGARLHAHRPNRSIGANWNTVLEVEDTQLVA